MNRNTVLAAIAIAGVLGASAKGADEPVSTRATLVSECEREAAQPHWAGNNARQHQKNMEEICQEWVHASGDANSSLLAKCLAEAGRGTFNWKRQRMWNTNHIKRQKHLCTLLSQSAT